MAKQAGYVFWQAFDDNGEPLAGGKVNTYEAGTTTPKVTYTSEDESGVNTNPVILDSAGRAKIWLDSGSYKFVMTDSADVLVAEEDNITGGGSNVFGSSVVAISTNTNVTSVNQNNVFLCSAALTLSLLDVSTAEEGFIISVKNTSAGDVIIDPDASELIDGAATKTVTAGGSLMVVCTGTAWITLFEDVGTTNSRAMTFSGNNTFSGTNSFLGVVSNSAFVKWAKGVDVASATALPLLTGGNYFDVTGTTTIETIDSLGVGGVVRLHFDDVLILTHDATDLVLPSGANITTAAGDEAEFVEYASGDWRCTNYSKASGAAVISQGGILGQGYVSTGALISSAVAIPQDDTIPQNTEGFEVLTLAYTPISATSKIVITLGCPLSCGSAQELAVVLFKDSIASALCAEGTHVGAGATDSVAITYEETSGSTTARTYKIRVGGTGAIVYVNGSAGARKFGGVSQTYIKIMEIEV